MKTTHIEYPYPILSPTTNDYKNKYFRAKINHTPNRKRILLDIEFELNSDFLKNLIKQGAAHYLILLECNSTRYRKIFTTTENRIEISIDEFDIGNNLSINILIVASSNIYDFKSDEFESYFKGISFNILCGDTLAKDKVRTMSIDKGYSKPVSSSSIFNIEQCEDDEPLNWDSHNDYILIKLPKKTYEFYTSLALNANTHSLITNTIIVPILTQILTEIRLDSTIYRDSNWLNVILEQLENLNISEDGLSSLNSIANIAYKIFPQSLDDSFKFVEDLLSNVEEEEE